jgi:DNA-binding beta-propeller fold protein YncE
MVAGRAKMAAMSSTRLSSLLVLLALSSIGAGAPERNPVDVQSWQPPRPGWLYVVDSAVGASTVSLFDPEHGEVKGIVRTGSNLDIALSPRGDRLYIAAVDTGCEAPECDRFAVIDTRSGRVLSITPIADRVHYKTYLESSMMAVSPDGRTVYVLKWLGLPSGEAPMGFAAFDDVHGRFLSGTIELGQCQSTTFVRAMDDDHISVHCASSNELVVLRHIAADRATVEFSVPLPLGTRLFADHLYRDVAARAFLLSADRRRLFVAGGDGAISDVNLALGSATVTQAAGESSEVVAPFASPGDLEHGRFYEAVGPYDGLGVAREIRIFDTRTWSRTGTIRTSMPFLTAVATDDGARIYAMTGDEGTVLAIDPGTQRELRAMPLGRTPSFALIAP